MEKFNKKILNEWIKDADAHLSTMDMQDLGNNKCVITLNIVKTNAINIKDDNKMTKKDFEAIFSNFKAEMLSISTQSLNTINSRFDRIEADIIELKSDVKQLKYDVKELQSDVKTIKSCPTIKKELADMNK